MNLSLSHKIAELQKDQRRSEGFLEATDEQIPLVGALVKAIANFKLSMKRDENGDRTGLFRCLDQAKFIDGCVHLKTRGLHWVK